MCNMYRAAPSGFIAVHHADPGCAVCPIGTDCERAEECEREAAESVDAMERDVADHVPSAFVMAMEAVFEAGVKGDRKPGDWMRITPAEAEAKMRSALRHLANGEYDAAACNCLILWWHFQRNA